MTNPNEEIEQLEKRLAELRAIKTQYLADWDSAILEDESRKPFFLGMYQISGMVFYMKPSRPISSELHNELYKKGIYSYPEYVAVNVLMWPTFMEHFDSSQIRFKDDVLKKKFYRILNGPHYTIDVSTSKKNLEILISPEADSGIIRRVDGYKHLGNIASTGESKYNVQLSQGYILFTTLRSHAEEHKFPITWVQWTEEANKLITSELETRALADTIAQLDDCPEFDPKFPNGMTLRPFQKVGGKFLQVTKRGILGHQPGLGKTPMAISIAYLEQSYNLVVCPASLRINWARQIYKFTNEHSLIIDGERVTEYLTNMILKKKDYKWVIISYDSLAAKIKRNIESSDNGTKKVTEQTIWPWVLVLNLAGFDRIIFDEYHYMKNPTTARAQAAIQMSNIGKCSLLSGTPIINRPREAFTALRFINPEMFNNYDGFVYQWEYNTGTCRNPTAFKEMLKPFMLRKLKSEVQKDLPPINRIDESHELSDNARMRYEKALAGVYEEIDKLSGALMNEMSITSILAQITRLKQICSDDKIEHAVETALNYYDETENKILIYSQFVGTCHAIAKRLGGEAITITGEVEFSERMKLVEEFQTSKSIHFAVCSSMAVREGLDLDKAMAVIFVDPLWAPAYHEQCEGRAYGRLSNEHGLDSYYLNAANTIEDWIADLRARKFALVSGTIDDLNSVRNSSMALDIIKMLKEEMSKKAWRKR
jgi:SNF2 family DNA or RNA helicase